MGLWWAFLKFEALVEHINCASDSSIKDEINLLQKHSFELNLLDINSINVKKIEEPVLSSCVIEALLELEALSEKPGKWCD